MNPTTRPNLSTSGHPTDRDLPSLRGYIEEYETLIELYNFEKYKTQMLLEARRGKHYRLSDGNLEKMELDDLKQLQPRAIALYKSIHQYNNSLIQACSITSSIPPPFSGQNSTATPFYVPQNVLGGSQNPDPNVDPTTYIPPNVPRGGNLPPNIHPSPFYSPNMLGGGNLPPNVHPSPFFYETNMLGGGNLAPTNAAPTASYVSSNALGGQSLNSNPLNRLGGQMFNPSQLNILGVQNPNPNRFNLMRGHNLNPGGNRANLYFPYNTPAGQNLELNSDPVQSRMLGATTFARGLNDQLPVMRGSSSTAQEPQDANSSTVTPDPMGAAYTSGKILSSYQGTNNPMGGSDVGMNSGYFQNFTSLQMDNNNMVLPSSSFAPQGSQFGAANTGSQFDVANAGSQFGAAHPDPQSGPANTDPQSGPANAVGNKENDYPDPNNFLAG